MLVGRRLAIAALRSAADAAVGGAGGVVLLAGEAGMGKTALASGVVAYARDRGAKALEAFAYRYREGESTYERFLVHRTVFPSDFLGDFGFRTVRVQGRVELARLELGGLVPVEEGLRARVMRALKEAVTPAPVPQRP